MSDLNNAYQIPVVPAVTPPAPSFNLPAIVPTLSYALLQNFFPKITGETQDAKVATTYIGTPVWSAFRFDYDPDTNIDGIVSNQQPLIISTCLVQVTMQKQIVKTFLPGRKDKNGNEVGGSVKEYISMGDYQINLVGELVGGEFFGGGPQQWESPMQYPATAVKYFNALMKLPKQLAVTCEFLNLFGISAIVIEDFNVSEKLGSRNEVLVSFSASSDIDITVNTQGT